MKNMTFVFTGKYRGKTGLYAMLNAYGGFVCLLQMDVLQDKNTRHLPGKNNKGDQTA